MQNSATIFRKKLILSLVLFIIVLLSGTAGYYFIEGWQLFDSLYMTVITLSTVGFHEIEPLSKAGKAFTIGLIFFSLGVVAFAVNYGLKAIFEGGIQIEDGDKISVIGEPEHFNQFEKMARGKRKSDMSNKSSTNLPEF